jgi:hypothetical protein
MYDDDPHLNYVKAKEEELQNFLEPFECKKSIICFIDFLYL